MTRPEDLRAEALETKKAPAVKGPPPKMNQNIRTRKAPTIKWVGYTDRRREPLWLSGDLKDFRPHLE